MNNKIYRLVYSKLRGMVVAVQETASATGKSHRGESAASGRAPAHADVTLFASRAAAFAAAMLFGAMPLRVSAQNRSIRTISSMSRRTARS
ncbi:ESPR domain-containing protein [Burkholderia oklahomensis]|uniref:ESPR domain-containing protein n=1 Tax=Burkholderia oklahomensis TaxID=342113 RepID=UPI0009D9654C|nr:ESPR domain-containing protein [Burkholderia oklahomensis]MBI0359682.1 ESPR domain-containing protein [Burkholderia oklahomensis]